MLQLKALDRSFPIARQLECDQSPAVLVNLFEVAADDEKALLLAWEADATWMKRQPGFISTQLHRAIGGSSLYLNYAIWENVACFREAFTNPEFRSGLAHYPSSAVAAPHLFKKLAVANLCTA